MKKIFLFLFLIIAFVASGQISVSTLGGFSSTQRFETANLTGPIANTTGFSVWVVMLPTTNTVNQFVFGKTNSLGSPVGWSFSNSGGFSLRVGDGTTAKIGPRVGFAPEELGTIQILHGVVKDGFIYTYKNGFKTDNRTAIASIGTFTGKTLLGSTTGGDAFQSSILSVGVCQSHGLTDAEVEAHYQAILLNINASATSASHHWVAVDAGATWVDRIASLSAARIGTITPSTVDHDFPQYRFVDTDYDFSNKEMLPKVPNVAGSMKVMPTGDSRTVGVGGTGTLAWRNGVTALKNATTDINNIDFVGPFSSSATDPQHNGRLGTTNVNHLNATGGVTVLPAALISTYSPDVIIHWLGVNSTSLSSDMVAEKQAYLDLLRAYYNSDNNIRFLLIEEATISDVWHNAGQENFRLWQRYVAWPLLRSEGLKIYTLYNPLKPSLGHYSDSVHPNDTGYAVLASVIYPALRNIFAVDYGGRITGVENISGVTKIIN